MSTDPPTTRNDRTLPENNNEHAGGTGGGGGGGGTKKFGIAAALVVVVVCILVWDNQNIRRGSRGELLEGIVVSKEQQQQVDGDIMSNNYWTLPADSAVSKKAVSNNNNKLIIDIPPQPETPGMASISPAPLQNILQGQPAMPPDQSFKADRDLFCTNNSTREECCSDSQCEIVRQSTLYSACCNNNIIMPGQQRQSGNSNDDVVAAVLNRRGASSRSRIIPVLITATPRSGTVFVKTLLNKLGVSTVTDWATPGRSTKVMVSWIHIMKEEKDRYFGPAKLYGSKFQYLWHQTRDPLKSLTSIAFTERLTDGAFTERLTDGVPKFPNRNTEIPFLKRHIELEDMSKLKDRIQSDPNNILDWEKIQNKSEIPEHVQSRFLIHRGMEFYIAWHSYILKLKVPRFSLEDLTVHQNYTIIDDIFKVLGKPVPSAERVQKLASNMRRRQRQRRLQAHTNSRKHRAILQWDELCRVNSDLAQDFLSLSHKFGYYPERESAC